MRSGRCCHCKTYKAKVYGNGWCSDCMREYKQANYDPEYYQKNKDRLREYNRAYYRKHRGRILKGHAEQKRERRIDQIRAEVLPTMPPPVAQRPDPFADKTFVCECCGQKRIRTRAGQRFCKMPKCQKAEKKALGSYSIATRNIARTWREE